MASSRQSEQAPDWGIRRFRIAGLHPEACAALSSMVRLLDARLTRRWQWVDSGHSDVLFLGTCIDAETEAAMVAQVTRVVRVAAYDCEHPGAALRLEYPFRVFQVLSVLQEVDQQLSIAAAGGSGMAAAGTCAGDVSLLSSLQSHANRNSHGQWLVARYADGRELFLSDDLTDFAAEESVHADVAVERLPSGPFMPSDRPAPHLRHAPGPALIWRVGLASAGGRLSPGLDPEGSYQISEWPDFGLIRPHRLHLRMAAVMAARAHTRRELADARGMGTLDEVTRFFNAAEASGLLHLVHAGAAPRTNARLVEPSSFIVGLVSRIRGKLGLASQAELGC